MEKQSSSKEDILKNYLNKMYLSEKEPETGIEIKIQEKEGQKPYLIKIRDFNYNFDLMMKTYYKCFSRFSDLFIIGKLKIFLYQAKVGEKYKSINDFANQIKDIKFEKRNFSFRLYGLDIDSDEILLGKYHLYKPNKFLNLVENNKNNLVSLYSKYSSSQICNENAQHTILFIKDLEFCEEDKEHFIKSEVSKFLFFLYFFLGRKDCCKNIKATFETIDYEYFVHNDNFRICGIRGSISESNFLGGLVTLSKEAFEHKNKKFFDLINYHDTDLKKRLFNAIYWIGNSLVDLSFSEGLLKVSIAAESLFSDGRENLGNLIAESVSFLISENVNERIKIFDNIKNYYGARSSLVHGDETSITYVKYYMFLDYLRDSISKIFELIEKKQDLSFKELCDYIKRLKFS